MVDNSARRLQTARRIRAVVVARETIRDQLLRVKRIGGKRDTATGLLYHNAAQKKKRSDAITLFGLFVSDAGTFMVRPHVFRSKEPRSPRQWNEYLSDNYGTILRESILPGMANRTDGKQWRLYRPIGWIPRSYSFPKNLTRPLRKKRKRATTRAHHTKTPKRRNKAKPQGRTRGHNHIRRRHRNTKR
jgi:hypothetical protein